MVRCSNCMNQVQFTVALTSHEFYRDGDYCPGCLKMMMESVAMLSESRPGITLDYKCSECGVGINNGQEKFNHKKNKVFCRDCYDHRRSNSSDFKEIVIECIDKINSSDLGINLSCELDALRRILD